MKNKLPKYIEIQEPLLGATQAAFFLFIGLKEAVILLAAQTIFIVLLFFQNTFKREEKEWLWHVLIIISLVNFWLIALGYLCSHISTR